MAAQTKDKNLEEDIESSLCSPTGGFLVTTSTRLYVENGTYQMVDGGYMAHRDRALDAMTLVDFVQTTQPKAWGALSACATPIPPQSLPRSSMTLSTAWVWSRCLNMASSTADFVQSSILQAGEWA